MRNLAVKHDLELSKIVATGRDGRIMKSDVLKYLDKREQESLECNSNEAARAKHEGIAK